MDYCGPRGIPHSHFLGWAEDDQQKALWWAARERRRCGGCGTHPDDWDEELGGSEDAYQAEVHFCPGCRRRAGVEARVNRDRESSPTSVYGAHVVLVRPDPLHSSSSHLT